MAPSAFAPARRARVAVSVWLFLALLVLVFAGTQLYLPPLFEARLEEALVQAFEFDEASNTPGGQGGPGAGGPVQVRLAAFPALRLLSGSLDHVDIEARGVYLDGFRVDNLHVQGRGVRIDRGQLTGSGQWELLHADALNAELRVSEASINEHLRNRPDLGGLFQATVADGSIAFRGSAVLFGRPVSLTVAGTFVPRDGTRIDFVPRDVAVDEAQIPRVLLDAFAQSDAMRIGVDLQDLPIPLEVSRIELEPGWLTLRARGRPAGRAGEGAAR